MDKQIENYIEESLSGEMRQTAMNFIEYLKANRLTFYKDNGDCWKDKIYYWVKHNDGCVCYIVIKDPDEPDHNWTIWSDDSSAYENADIGEEIKNVGWNCVDYCSSCGSCGGGRQKVIFGKSFERVCGCTFRIDNAMQSDLPFLKTMIDLRLNQISKL